MARNRAPPGAPRHDYEVGYGQPPRHSRFESGQSGNPRGRPKGSANLATYLAKALSEKVVVKEGGRRRMITKAEAIATQLVNKAAGADLRAMKMLLIIESRRERVPLAIEREKVPVGPKEQPTIDLSALSTDDLQVVYDAVLILEGRKERPPIPLPPTDPTEVED